MANSIKAAAAVLGITAVSLVQAQMTPNPWYVRLGVTYPTSSETRDGTTNVGFGGGVGYLLTGPGVLGKDATPSVELLYNHISGNGNKIDNFVLQYIERFGLAPKAETGMYYGVGVGVQFSKVDAQSASSGGGSGGEDVLVGRRPFTSSFSDGGDFNKTTIAGELLVGYRFTAQAAFELSWRVAPKINDVDTNMLTAMVNLKF